VYIELSFLETRVIGCLVEKEITTPDQYPLSLNALTNACNQKSNRDPVLNVDEQTVQETVDGLVKQHLAVDKTGFGSRVLKYSHRFCNSRYGPLQFSPQELGIVCELLLRGPQTPGELRTRTSRLCRFAEVGEVEAALRGLAEREDGPFVVKLPRESGRRDSRFAHLFSGDVDFESLPTSDPKVPRPNSGSERLARLEQRMETLDGEIQELRTRLEQLLETHR
jgi:hypothetical protein